MKIIILMITLVFSLVVEAAQLPQSSQNVLGGDNSSQSGVVSNGLTAAQKKLMVAARPESSRKQVTSDIKSVHYVSPNK